MINVNKQNLRQTQLCYSFKHYKFRSEADHLQVFSTDILKTKCYTCSIISFWSIM